MKKAALIVAGSLAIVLACLTYSHYQRQRCLQAALATGRLAALPATATLLQADTKGGLFSRTYWLTFQAHAADIGRWLSESEVTGPLPAAQAAHRAAGAPAWFTLPADSQGPQVFRIEVDEEQALGMIWVDQVTGTVSVQLSRG